MALRPLAERIVLGTACPAEVHLDCAARLLAWIEDTGRHHTAETCNSRKPKDCCHAPGEGEVELAAEHTHRAPQVCTCGAHV